VESKDIVAWANNGINKNRVKIDVDDMMTKEQCDA
jgi:hypothetical protein